MSDFFNSLIIFAITYSTYSEQKSYMESLDLDKTVALFQHPYINSLLLKQNTAGPLLHS